MKIIKEGIPGKEVVILTQEQINLLYKSEFFKKLFYIIRNNQSYDGINSFSTDFEDLSDFYLDLFRYNDSYVDYFGHSFLTNNTKPFLDNCNGEDYPRLYCSYDRILENLELFLKSFLLDVLLYEKSGYKFLSFDVLDDKFINICLQVYGEKPFELWLEEDCIKNYSLFKKISFDLLEDSLDPYNGIYPRTFKNFKEYFNSWILSFGGNPEKWQNYLEEYKGCFQE